jgi:hypothetical protein
MYSVSEEYAQKIKSNNRAFSLKLTFISPTDREITGTTIQNISLDEIVNSTDVLTMGCACSHKITVNLINPPMDMIYDGAVFNVEVGLLINERPIEYAYVPLGKFYGAEVSTSNDYKTLTLTAYDGFYKMTGKYDATVPKNTTLQAVYDDLKTQLYEKCGIVLKSRTLPHYTITDFPYLEKVTYTQAIGYVAGCLGEFARFDRNGELECAWYTESEQLIDRSQQYMDGFKRTTNKTLTVTSLSTGTQEKAIVRGNGANGININFENPYITNAMADSIYARINGLTYTPCQVKWRGNPAIQAGDKLKVFDKENVPHDVLVMSQSVKIGGGCSATIDCKGNTQTVSNFSNKFESTSQKIERMYNILEQAILNATNAITGNKGGYVKLYDSNGDGNPDELLIMDTDNVDTATKVWRWNTAGLGFANGYNGTYKTAITADGQINADCITTGTLNANLIRIGDANFGDYVRIENGTMLFGKKDNPLTLKLENEQVAFYIKGENGEPVRIAYFSNNSFEIENLEEGKIRFQNFGFIPRKTGNLSFTKLT